MTSVNVLFLGVYNKSLNIVCGQGRGMQWRACSCHRTPCGTFYHVGPRDPAQVIRLDGKCL